MQEERAKQVIKNSLDKDGCVVFSEGTMNSEDIFDKVAVLLPRAMQTKGQKLANMEDGSLDEFMEWTVWPYLDELTPPGYYCGASEGDGACFGIWKEED